MQTSQLALDTELAIFKFSVFPEVTGMSQDCLTNPSAKPVCPLVVIVIPPIAKSCEPSLTALPSKRAPTTKSAVATGAVTDRLVH